MTIISIPGDIRPELRMTIVCNVEYVLGQQGGRNEKTSAPKCSEGLRKSSGKLEKLFSSFLRGASCPKSPRVAATAAKSFMPEGLGDVKWELGAAKFGLQRKLACGLR